MERWRLLGGATLVFALLTSPTAPSPSALTETGVSGRGLTDFEPFNVDDPIWVDPDDLEFSRPLQWNTLQLYDVYVNLFLDPGDAHSRRAMNINTLGEVPDSSWFTNRLGWRDMEPEDVAGPHMTGAPVPELFTVVGWPGAGVTPKFLVEDVAGQRFVFKLDPRSNPEMASAAEIICSRFFRAAGYNVPETYVARVHESQLRIADGAAFEDALGEERNITYEDLDHWLADAAMEEDGSYRVLASKIIPGVKVGEFRFHGTRPDDPNDIFPHEHRRELRAYRVFSAWLNHDDSRATNTYDAFQGEGSRGYIKHYLLDFGSCLGSATVEPNKLRGGNEYFLEKAPILKSLATLGLWRRPWNSIDYPGFPAVGNLEAEYFDPASWKPEYPNAAFLRMDAADAFWGARIVARFSDDIIRAVVQAAQISDPEAVDYMVRTLVRRRDKVVRQWVVASNPLDRFEVSGSEAVASLRWTNAAVHLGVAAPPLGYEVWWSRLDNDTGSESPIAKEGVSGAPETDVPAGAWGPRDVMGDRYARARIATRHPGFPGWGRPVVVTLRERGGELSVVGVVRPREQVGPDVESW